jgi:hypothetical protein
MHCGFQACYFLVGKQKILGGKKEQEKEQRKKEDEKDIDAWKLEALRTGSEGSTGQRSLLMSIGD